MKENSNVINLIDYIEDKKKINTNPSQTLINSVQENLLSKRTFSFCIDVAAIFTIKALIDLSFLMFVTNFFHTLDIPAKTELLKTPIWFNSVLFMTCYIGYFLFTPIVLNGQTIGQKVYKLKVFNSNGEAADHFKSVGLRVLGYLSYYFGAGLFHLFYFTNKERRSFADIISKTYVTTKDSPFKEAQVVTIEISSLDQAA